MFLYIMSSKIENIQIYGERCSGTNYLEKLLDINFHVNIKWNYGWKHFFGFHDLSNSDNTLFVCIIRNPIDWINSLYRTPHHIPHHLLENKDSFLNYQFYSIYKNKNNFGKEILHDRNIFTKNKYNNIFELRKTKINFLLNELPTKVKNYIFIRYEDLIDNFEITINKIKNKGLKVKSLNFPENYYNYKKTNKKFIKEKKTEFFTKDDFLNNPNFDYEIEKKLGYL